jgi:prepilin-type N-terminal cleavage/methylation domain-containing protein
MRYRGFTLIEIVIVIALVASAGIILVDLFIGHNRLYKTQTAELNVTSAARTALDDIDNYVRQANRTLSTYSTYNGSSTVLILRIQSVNSSQQLVAGTYDHVVYELVGSDLIRRIFADAASSRTTGVRTMASNVTGFSISYNDDFAATTEVGTNITIQENAGVQNRSITLSSNARLRSY